MAQEIKTVIPDEYKNYYDNITINPNAMDMGFKIRDESEKTKEHVRQSSNLYPIFGEKMFGFVQDNRQLHLDVDLFDLADIAEELFKEIDLALVRLNVVRSLGNSKVMINEVNSVTWDVTTFDKTIGDDITAMQEAVSALTVIGLKSLHGYVPDKEKKDIKAILRMLRAVKLSGLDLTQQQYMKNSIMAKELDFSVRSINWRYEYFISKQS